MASRVARLLLILAGAPAAPPPPPPPPDTTQFHDFPALTSAAQHAEAELLRSRYPKQLLVLDALLVQRYWDAGRVAAHLVAAADEFNALASTTPVSWLSSYLPDWLVTARLAPANSTPIPDTLLAA